MVLRAGGSLEEGAPDFIEAGKVVQISQKDLRFDDIVQGASRRGEGRRQIFKNEFGLQLDVRAVKRKAGFFFALSGIPVLKSVASCPAA